MSALLNKRGCKLAVDAGSCRPRSRDCRASRLLAERKAELAVTRAEFTGARLRIERYKDQPAKLRRMQFGHSSEKLDVQIQQLELMLEDLEEGEAARPAPAAKRASDRLREPRPPMRRLLPDHLPREEIVHHPGSVCPTGGGTRFAKAP